jgi:serpin B
MGHETTGILVLVAIIALGIVIAGCTGTQSTMGPTVPPTGQATPGDQPGMGDATDNATRVAEGNNQFAFDLYARLIQNPDYAGANLFFSPYSISSALAITYEGARGATADEIRSVLHLPENDTIRREGFSEINAGINSGDAGYALHTANALWAEETYPFLPGYIGTAQRYYSANVTNLDFINKPEESRKAINAWVEEQTEDKIQNLLPDGSIDPLTRLVITNAIYFKGPWVKQFEKNETTMADFRTDAGSTVQVLMMQRTDEEAVYPYAETETLQVLAMPYAHESGNELSMLVILPKDENLTAAEATLDAQELADLRQSLASQRVKVYFPKFTLETEYGLPDTLAAMGMPTAFTGAADFSGMDGSKNLFISNVVHKAFIDVNEEGTEAAAATGVVMVLSAAPSEPPIPVFRADHPFTFLIQENETGNILFMGRVVHPSSS